MQRLMHGLLLLKMTRLAELMPRPQGVCSSRAALPSSVPHFQYLAVIPGVEHWGGKPWFVVPFQETIPACFLKSSPVDGGIVAWLWDTAEDACGSLGTGARKSPVYPASRERQSATGLCTRCPAGIRRREVWGLRYALALFF